MRESVKELIHRQIQEINKEGFVAIFRKIAAFITLLFALPFVLLVRILRPIITIRFGCLAYGRIGHLAGNTEYYIGKREMSKNTKKPIDFFCYNHNAANKQLMKMWSRVLKMYAFICPLWKLNRMLPGGAAHEIDLAFNDYEHVSSLLAQTKKHIFFTKKEEEFGYKEIEKIGINRHTPFVCFHARDKHYLNTLRPGVNWEYHDFRDASVENFLLAAQEMTKRGYYAVRMGAIVKEPLPSSDNAMIIDYAARYRTDFMDVFLIDKCKFFIATNAGIADLVDILRKPVARTNVIQFYAEIPLLKEGDIFIPKKLWHRKEKRFLTFKELVKSDIWRGTYGEQFEKAGVDVMENTSQEILDLAIEVDERLNGTWKETKEDEEFQKRFWGILTDAGKLKGSPVSRIGAKFLRDNQYLLNEQPCYIGVNGMVR